VSLRNDLNLTYVLACNVVVFVCGDEFLRICVVSTDLPLSLFYYVLLSCELLSSRKCLGLELDIKGLSERWAQRQTIGLFR